MIRWELRVEEPGKPPLTVAGRSGLRLGRHPDNDVVVDDPKCSGFHVELREGAGSELVLADCGSANQTRVESGPVLGKDETHPIGDGMRAFVGRTVITFIERVAPTDAAPSDESMDPEFAAQETVPGASVRIAPSPPKLTPKPKPEPKPESGDDGDATPTVAPDEEPSEVATIFGGNMADAIGRHGAGSALTDIAEFRVARPRLVIASEAISERIEMDSPVAVIGRSRKKERGVTCLLLHDAVSSVHSKITYSNGRFTLEDCESKNGTYFQQELLLPGQPRELQSDAHLRFGTVDALWVTDRDASGNKISEQKYQDAVEILVAEGAITQLVARKVKGDGKDRKMHPGEVLLLDGRITVAQWCDALARAPFLNVIRDRESGRSARTWVILLILVAIALAALLLLRPDLFGLGD
ncbi:MAG: FHA domain-containing protein [Planctomycetes bacterium]|nr:FHA domain-containing protein [Planctomycetota bacterium]